MSENAHRVVFHEVRPMQMDRIDHVLLVVDGLVPLSYVTVRELDSETVYWQYGGAFPSSAGTLKVMKSYRLLIEFTKRGYKRISTLVQNTNISYLKMALSCGFVPMGVRFVKGEIYVELLNEFGGV